MYAHEKTMKMNEQIWILTWHMNNLSTHCVCGINETRINWKKSRICISRRLELKGDFTRFSRVELKFGWLDDDILLCYKRQENLELVTYRSLNSCINRNGNSIDIVYMYSCLGTPPPFSVLFENGSSGNFEISTIDRNSTARAKVFIEKKITNASFRKV